MYSLAGSTVKKQTTINFATESESILQAMSSCYHLLTVLIIFGTSYSLTTAAPVGWTTTSSYSSTPQRPHSIIEMILNNAIFNSTDNFYTIKKTFQVQPGIHKICIPIDFNISCANQSECSDVEVEKNCTSGFYKSVLWTEFDTTDIAGRLMLYFASSNLNVFGFDWAGACENPIDVQEQSNISTPIINLVVSASFLCSNTSIESEIHDALIYLTTLVRTIHNNNMLCGWVYNCMVCTCAGLYTCARVLYDQNNKAVSGVYESSFTVHI